MPTEFPLHQEMAVYASAARTATPTALDYDNPAHLGAVVFIDCTAVADTPSVVFTIQGKEPLGDEYYDILASAAITGTGNTVLRVYPTLTAAANAAANHPLPRVWRVLATHADADSITYSVTACLLR
jgi:hypothetical protein